MPCSVSSLAGCSDGGDIAGGVGFSARCERRLEREVGHGERGKTTRGLTVSPFGGSVGSRAAGVQRIDDDDLRWLTRGTVVLAVSRGFRRRAAR